MLTKLIQTPPDAYFLSLSDVTVDDMASTEVSVSEFVGEQQIVQQVDFKVVRDYNDCVTDPIQYVFIIIKIY